MADPQSSQCFLWNPVTLVRIELPVSPHSFINFKCILSFPPTDSDCTVMCCNFLKQYVMFCRPGDKVWICHQYSDIAVREVLSCKGQFYGVTALRELVIFNFDPEPRLIIMDIARSKPRRNCWHDEALLESCGDIFLVDRFLVDSMKSTGDIEVLKLDLSKQRWDEVDDIGDRVFLVNSFGSSESLSASRLGIKKGCIYFTDCWDKHLYVYDLEEQIISSTLPCPNVKEKFWTPFFLIPSHAL